jgi:uncharacterized protein (TIGR03067 family)
MKLHALTALALTGLLAAQLGAVPDRAPGKNRLKEEMKRLQGSWTFVSGEADGQVIAEELYKKNAPKLRIEGTKFVVRINTGDITQEATWKIDPAKKPRTIDLTLISGKDKGQTQLGIYEVKGDTFKVCFARPGNKSRPTAFATKPKTGYRITVMKRVKS